MNNTPPHINHNDSSDAGCALVELDPQTSGYVRLFSSIIGEPVETVAMRLRTRLPIIPALYDGDLMAA